MAPLEIAFEENAAIPVADYRRLRRAVGWGELPADDGELSAALARTWNVVARHTDEVVAFGRLLDDGLLYASIWDMIVAPDLQRRGIGNDVLTRLLQHADARSLTVLVATRPGRGLYERHGFVPADLASTAMLRRRAR
ncbi:MAG TPA: GNAT family N-acetyltransferase [Gaiellaceae bacterium]|nr:GNAT family N-acetyltransferase [Gaiellaceae bacterium]